MDNKIKKQIALRMKTWVEISKPNLIHNFKEFRKIVGSKTKIAVIVKSNAYGHGLNKITAILDKKFNNKSVWFGVDSIDEAIKLRKSNIKAPILILGYTLLNRLEDAIKHNIRLTVYNKETIKKLGKLKNLPRRGNGKIKIHIKIETGTSRQGVVEDEIFSFINLIKKYPRIEIEGISTHFANIEDTTNHSFAEKQLEKFNGVVKFLERNNTISKIPIKHTACSAAAILFPETHFDMIRAGISIYGLWSSKKTLLSALGRTQIVLKPVLSWKTKIAQIKKIKKGTSVSYGLTEKVKQDSKIAILPIGYFDGYDRKMSSIGNVLIQGKRCKILGRICMNMCVADITDLEKVKLEDEVVILGKQGKEEITAEEIAEKIKTINYEVVARINPLIPKIIK